LNGSCLSPIAILCKEDVYGINISAKVLSQNGQKEIYREIRSSHENLTKDIHSLADDFISNDAHLMILE
jgi:porphobilinogen deaminase